MKRRTAATLGAMALFAIALLAAPAGGQLQQSRSPIDDLLERAQNAYNDLNYLRADTIARQVLALGNAISSPQRDRALMVIAAAAFPDDPPAHRRADAMDALRRLVRSNLAFTMPVELTWPGLNALVEEARSTTFGLQVSADSMQVVVGGDGRASIRVRSSRPGQYRLVVAPEGGTPVIADSVMSDGDNGAVLRFPVMRDRKPIFAAGNYDVLIIGIDAAMPDTISLRFQMTADAPPLQLANLDIKVDSSKLLPERSGRFGYKSIFPALVVGAAAFAFSNALSAEGGVKDAMGGDAKGMAVGVALVGSTIAAGFLDRGRPIPANAAANLAYGEAVRKAIEDARADNERRVAGYRATLRFNMEPR